MHVTGDRPVAAAAPTISTAATRSHVSGRAMVIVCAASPHAHSSSATCQCRELLLSSQLPLPPPDVEWDWFLRCNDARLEDCGAGLGASSRDAHALRRLLPFLSRRTFRRSDIVWQCGNVQSSVLFVVRGRQVLLLCAHTHAQRCAGFRFSRLAGPL